MPSPVIRNHLGLMLVLLLLVVACGESEDATADDPEEGTGGGETEGAEAGEGPSEDAGDPIRIGSISQLTGPVADIGEDTLRGAQFAVDEINEAGGLLGREVELIGVDDQNDPGVGQQVATQLIRREGVVGILGPILSAAGIAIQPLQDQNEIPAVAYNSGAEALTAQGSEWVFRSSTTLQDGYESLVRHASEAHGYESIAFLGWNETAGEAALEGVERAVEGLDGAELVAVERLAIDTSDFSGSLSTLEGADPDALVIGAPLPFAGVAVNQTREAGWDVPLLGWGGFITEEFGPFTGDSSDGMVMTDTSHWEVVEDASEEGARMVEAYREEHGEEPNANELIGYDAAMILMNAIEEAGSTEGADIASTLRETRLEGVRMEYEWMETGDLLDHPIVVVEWQDGELQLLEESAPAAEGAGDAGE